MLQLLRSKATILWLAAWSVGSKHDAKEIWKNVVSDDCCQPINRSSLSTLQACNCTQLFAHFMVLCIQMWYSHNCLQRSWFNAFQCDIHTFCFHISLFLEVSLLTCLIRPSVARPIHAVVWGFMKHVHSYRGNVHAYWVWPREIILRRWDVHVFYLFHRPV